MSYAARAVIVAVLTISSAASAADALDEHAVMIRDLRVSGWEGVWSQDCSVPNETTTIGGRTRFLGRVRNIIDEAGHAYRDIETVTDGKKSVSRFTIEKARLVTHDKLMVTMHRNEFSVDATFESVILVSPDKLTVLRSRTFGTVMRHMAPGYFSTKDLSPGDAFDFISSEDGVAKDASGRVTGGTTLERCLE